MAPSQHACADCLTRGSLLRELAANIDRSVDKRVGERARDLLALADEELALAVSPDRASGLRTLERCREQASSPRLRHSLAQLGLGTTCRHHGEGWPGEAFSRLGEAAPRALYLRGDASLLDPAASAPQVTIVGARRAGAYGREVAGGLATELGAAGALVISGMAFGIDTAAHEGALAAGAPTIAVLGAGAERAYPQRMAGLYRRICSAGLVVSELPPGTPTFRWTFPARNRIMAALAGITVVVEAAERSGSLITAEMASDCGRIVGAVPGPVNSWRSSGTNLLLADGARLIRGAADVLEELLGPGYERQRRRGPDLDPDRLRVLDLFERGCETADEIAAVGDLEASAVAVALSRLELDGYLSRGAGGGYARSSLCAP